MSFFSAPSSMTAFLTQQGQATVVDCYLQLLAEEKLRWNQRRQELTSALARLQGELQQQHSDAQQLQQDLSDQAAWRTQAEFDLEHQARLLAAYRESVQNSNDTSALLDGLFQQAFESSNPNQALDIYREIAEAKQPDDTAPVRQLRGLSRLNIGVILATQINEPIAARQTYEQLTSDY